MQEVSDWKPEMARPNNRYYSEQITKEDYEFQRQAYTKQQVDDLMNTIRHNPNLIRKTPQYFNSHRNYQFQEAVLKGVFYVIFACTIHYIIYSSGFHVTKERVQNEYSDLVCGSSLSSTQAGANELIFEPKFIFGFGIATFLIWIFKMALDNKHYGHSITVPLQLLRTVFGILVPTFTIFILIIVSTIFTRGFFINNPSPCSSFISRIIDTPIIGDIIRGSDSIIRFIFATWLQTSHKTIAFLSASLALSFLFFLARTLAYAILHRSIIDIFSFLALLTTYSLYITLEDKAGMDRNKRGENFIFFIVIAKLVGVATEGLRLMKGHNWDSITAESSEVIIDDREDGDMKKTN